MEEVIDKQILLHKLLDEEVGFLVNQPQNWNGSSTEKPMAMFI